MRGVADGCGYLLGRVTTILLRVSDFSNKFRYSSLGVQNKFNVGLRSPQRQGVACTPVEVVDVVRIASLI